jgi:hypothetical protein
VHATVPVAAAYLPAAQTPHDATPAAEYLPTTQLVQLLSPAAAYLPATQSTQAEDMPEPAGDTVPAAQLVGHVTEAPTVVE